MSRYTALNASTASHCYERPIEHQPVAHTDVAIVGAGVVGLTLACALRHSGLSVAIIETQKQDQVGDRDRAYAFSPMSARIFQQMGLWEQVGPYITHFQRVRMSDADYGKAVNFYPTDSPVDAVYYGAEHRVLVRALQGLANHIHRITTYYETTLADIQATATTTQLTLECDGQKQTLHTQLLVGADGARSKIRDYAGIRTSGWAYWQSCITTVLAPAKSHQNTAYEKFWPSGPFAILPIPGNRCQVVWTAPHEEAAAMLALPQDAFMAKLRHRYGDHMGELTMIKPPMMFPVRLMHSERYVQPGIALIGDSAHCCHPVGGQGLNMGIRDAAALARVLHAAHACQEPIGDLRVLKRYERWRRPENWLILAMTDLLNRMFSNQVWPLLWLRRSGLWIIEHTSPLKRMILRVMTGFFGQQPIV
ncbi:FAD-dependent hydroxylase [Leptothoe sp. PORK10 BA2]|uniref:FAD-dependent hydroxylase n=1 Tax=Leptothoe sp. PORK10 BA2 TaxID=3110254 RepID=UPI002B2161FF|nr:FAD-dependent hydroxylase [Leptothoe sp. PORK10 BA2]